MRPKSGYLPWSENGLGRCSPEGPSQKAAHEDGRNNPTGGPPNRGVRRFPARRRTRRLEGPRPRACPRTLCGSARGSGARVWVRPPPPAPRESGERTRRRQTRGRRAARPTGRAAGVLTAFGLYGGWISLRSSFSQSMYRKNACSLTSRSPSGPQPRRLPGCLVISCKRTQRSATWDELREGRTGKDGGFQLAARPRRDLPARPA